MPQRNSSNAYENAASATYNGRKFYAAEKCGCGKKAIIGLRENGFIIPRCREHAVYKPSKRSRKDNA